MSVQTLTGCNNLDVTFLWCWRGLVSPSSTNFSKAQIHRQTPEKNK